MRITEKNYWGYGLKTDLPYIHNYNDLVTKLGKIEDLEEEMGIDVIEFLEEYKRMGYPHW